MDYCKALAGGLNVDVLKALKKHGYEAPTPIQAQALPALLSGRDVLARAPYTYITPVPPFSAA